MMIVTMDYVLKADAWYTTVAKKYRVLKKSVVDVLDRMLLYHDVDAQEARNAVDLIAKTGNITEDCVNRIVKYAGNDARSECEYWGGELERAEFRVDAAAENVGVLAGCALLRNVREDVDGDVLKALHKLEETAIGRRFFKLDAVNGPCARIVFEGLAFVTQTTLNDKTVNEFISGALWDSCRE